MRRAQVAASLVVLLIASACSSTGSPGASGPSGSFESPVSSDDAADGWRPLFDGRTTAGWRGYRRPDAPGGWQVVDGALTRVAEAGDLMTIEQFGDFELELEWSVAPGGNSGIMFHVTEDHGAPWETGPEMQVLDNAGHQDGGDPLTSAGSAYALYAPEDDETLPTGEWNAARLVVHGPHVEHWLNDELLLEYELWSEDWEQRVAASKFGAMPDFGRRERGHIVLQDHGDRVAFRNIRLRDLQP
jgi:hypothetical protein